MSAMQPVSPWLRRVTFALVGGLSLVLFCMAWARFHYVHNETFDLAFYARMAWGLAVFDLWDPLQNAHVLGLHVSPVMLPLGWLGRVFGTVPVLLAAQVAAVAGAALLLGRVGARQLGPWGQPAGALAFLLHPNISHVVSYEWHPGTLAVLPLAWVLDRLDEDDARGTCAACLGVLACREDFALVTGLVGGMLIMRRHRRLGSLIVAFSGIYLAFFLFVLHPRYAPAGGSFALHFGHLGGSPAQAVMNLLSDPLRLFAAVDAAQLWWVAAVLAPLLFLPLLAPWWWWIPALPTLAIAFISRFPTTSQIDSHYLTAALPPLVCAAIHGARLLPRFVPPARAKPLSVAFMLAASVAWAAAGQYPWSPAFRADVDTRARRAMLDQIPQGVSVQAPDPLLPHLAERPRLHRGWREDRGAAWLVLSTAYRHRYAGLETLLRTSEEPVVRAWLAKDTWGVVAHEESLILLRRGHDPRAIVREYLLTDAVPITNGTTPTPLTSCLGLLGSRKVDGQLELYLEAQSPCPSDLALRIDGRVELLFDGVLSPSHLRAGDQLRSRHTWTGSRPVIAVLRSSGARPHPLDPEGIVLDTYSTKLP